VLFDVTLYGVVMVKNIWRKTLPLSGGKIYIYIYIYIYTYIYVYIYIYIYIRSNLRIMKLVQNVNLMRPEIFSGPDNTGHKENIINL
jgi:hypothetical protein